MRIKKYLKIGKPSVKGGVMVLLGIFNSRGGISVEIFTNNLIFGSLAYFFLSLSGITSIKLLRILNNSSDNSRITKRGAILSSGIFFLIGLILTVINVIENMVIYYFNIIIIIFTIFIGILWIVLVFLGYKKMIKIEFINILIVSLVFSIGLVYGAFLNTFIIPINIYFFFLSIILLQLSRELMKCFNTDDLTMGFIRLDSRIDQENVLKVTLIFQILILLSQVFLISVNISYSVLFLTIMIFSIFIISLAGILTLESILERKISYKIGSILKIGVFIELISLLVIGN